MVSVHSERELPELILSLEHPVKVLGGGSNILIKDYQDCTILHNKIEGIKIIQETTDDVIIEAGGGEDWPSFVAWAVDRGYGGIENLSLIPGTVGAAPIQNIGAYGVEQEATFVSLTAFDLLSGEEVIMHGEDCRFGYRDSIFKNKLKGKLIISSVRYRLSKKPTLELSYGAIKERLAELRISNPIIGDIAQVVTEIRRSKLPDPAQLGNSGSFFKNPIISEELYRELILSFPDMPSYPLSDGNVKIPAGWLIEQCGWKGKVIGNTGTYTKQALVIVNYGGATGEEIWALAQDIIRSVEEKFKVVLMPEVNIW